MFKKLLLVMCSLVFFASSPIAEAQLPFNPRNFNSVRRYSAQQLYYGNQIQPRQHIYQRPYVFRTYPYYQRPQIFRTYPHICQPSFSFWFRF